MKGAKSFYADTSLLVEAMREKSDVLENLENAEKVFTGTPVVYELSKYSRLERSDLEGNLVLDFSLDDANRAGELYSEMESDGSVIPQIDIMIAAQALNEGLPVATFDDDFRRVPGLETLMM